MSELLNLLLVNLINLKYQAKSAHWNVRGMLFYQFHLMFDRIQGEYDKYIDQIAEKIGSLGNKANGTIPQVAANTAIPNQDFNLVSGLEFTNSLLIAVNALRDLNISIMDNEMVEEDQAVLNMLAGLQETLDSHKYLLQSHLV